MIIKEKFEQPNKSSSDSHSTLSSNEDVNEPENEEPMSEDVRSVIQKIKSNTLFFYEKVKLSEALGDSLVSEIDEDISNLTGICKRLGNLQHLDV